MKLTEIARWVRLADEHGLSELEFSRGTRRLRLRGRRDCPAFQPQNPFALEPTARTQRLAVSAPAAGLFRAVHPARLGRFVEEGQLIHQGQIVAFVQTGPVLRPVIARRRGIIGRLLVAEGAFVNRGTPLIALA